MPTLDFKGKQHIYAHHLTVPCQILAPDEKPLPQFAGIVPEPSFLLSPSLKPDLLKISPRRRM